MHEMLREVIREWTENKLKRYLPWIFLGPTELESNMKIRRHERIEREEAMLVFGSRIEMEGRFSKMYMFLALKRRRMWNFSEAVI